ncbi:MAG: DUF2845 domain-containing protein [bacterium]|nr:DUF2845 domain-containing protein [bacterium]
MKNELKGKKLWIAITLICSFLLSSCGLLSGDVSKKVKIGMSQSEVMSLCGAPTRKRISHSTSFSGIEVKEEWWVYKGILKVYYVKFIYGRVSAVHEND